MYSPRCATNLLLMCIAACFYISSPLLGLAGQGEEEWGKAVNGLQMSIYPERKSRDSTAAYQFRVEIRNVGQKDLLLLLGQMLANGRIQRPEAVRLLMTNPQGENLNCGVPGEGIITGLILPFIVPLPVGASYSLPVDLKSWTANWTRCYTPRDAVPLREGKYTLRAQYSASAEDGNSWPDPGGPRPRFQQPDQMFWGAFILMPKWIGTVISDQAEFQLPAHSSAN